MITFVEIKNINNSNDWNTVLHKLISTGARPDCGIYHR